MPFIRAKTRKNSKHLIRPGRLPSFKAYHYLVENYRENSRVRQRTLAYLGKYPTVEEALAGLPDEIWWWRGVLARVLQVRIAAKSACEYEQAERDIVEAKKRIAGLEARLAKLQALSRSPEPLALSDSRRDSEGSPDGSDHKGL